MKPALSEISGNRLPDTTIGGALIEGERRLVATGFVLKPRRHAELLLETALALDRTTLYLRAGEILSDGSWGRYDALLRRRESGEPVQYIVGWTPFYGRNFIVGPGVFIPRFDSEIIISRALEITQSLSRSVTPSLLDLCCGCGALGLSLAAEIQNTRVVLTDVSDDALECTARNALALIVNNRIETVKWDALAEPPEVWRNRFDVVVANPPYIPTSDLANLHQDVRDYEPREALTDGGDGLTYYRRWAETLTRILKPGGVLLVEVGDGRSDAVKEILAPSFKELTVHPDLSGNFRAVEGTVKSY